MAEQKVILAIGSSNMAGFGASLDDVPTDDMTRWVGAGSLHPPLPSPTSAQLPYHVSVAGCRVLTPRRPYSTNVGRTIATVPAVDQLTYNGGDLATPVDQWVYIRTNSTGQGNLRKITVDGVSAITVNARWMPDLAANGTAHFLQDSHTVTGTSSTTTVINKTAATGALTAAVVGRDVIFFGKMQTFTSDHPTETFTTATDHGLLNGTRVRLIRGTGGGDALPAGLSENTDYFLVNKTATTFQLSLSVGGAVVPISDNGVGTHTFQSFEDIVRRITAFDTDQITIDHPLSVAPTAGYGFCILTGANSCETMADLANPAKCALRDLQFYIDKNAPVDLTGFDYGNYDQTPFQNPRTAFAGPTTINCIWELQWQMRTRLGNAPIVLIEIGVSASMVSPFLQGKIQGPAPIVPFAGFIGWFHDLLSLDFHPSSPSSIYTALSNCITSTKALIAAEGNSASFQSTNINLADNDPADAIRVNLVGSNFVLLRDALRAQTSPQMLWLMAGPARYAPPEATRQLVYNQLFQIETDDPRSGVFDTRGFLVPQDFWVVDLLHLSALGQIKLGKGFTTTWDTTHVRANDAARLTAELPTLATIRTRARRRYERSDVGNDATQTQIDMFINDSIRELYNTVGDEKAWFLRRIEEVDIESGLYPNTITLPRTVKRLLRIESGSSPGCALAWKGIGHTDAGRTQIALHNVVSGPFLLHFITLTKDLVSDSDVAIIPEEYVELVVILTCKRLTECAGNMTMAAYYAAEADRMWRVVKRSCQLHDRMRQGQMEHLNTYDATTNSAWAGGDELVY